MITNRKTLNALIGAVAIAAGGLAGSAFAAEDAGAISGEYQSEAKHRYITFSYMHQGLSRPHLRWRNWDATLDWNAEEPTASSISVDIDAASIDSGVDEFDGHLRGEQFFDVENHPNITFVSTSLTKISENTGTMTGDLTIKGVTKPVTLDVTMNNGFFDARGNQYKIGFSATGSVKRSDFGVDLYAPFVGDDVDLTIEAEFVMPAKAE